MHTPIIERVVKQMETLPEVKQKQVLEFIEKPKGSPVGFQVRNCYISLALFLLKTSR